MRASLFAAPLALIVTAATLTLSAGPAMASSEACATAAPKLRTMAASAPADVQRKAVRNIDLGEALCEARNKADAAKKFNLAAKAMGTDLATVLASGVTASAQ